MLRRAADHWKRGTGAFFAISWNGTSPFETLGAARLALPIAIAPAANILPGLPLAGVSRELMAACILILLVGLAVSLTLFQVSDRRIARLKEFSDESRREISANCPPKDRGMGFPASPQP